MMRLMPERALRRHLGDGRDLPEMALERRGNARRHRLWAGAGQLRLNENGREIDLRQRRDGQVREGNRPEQRDADGEKRRRDGPGDKGCGQVHSIPRSGAAVLARPASG